MLNHLPAEILLSILTHLSSPSDLNNTAKTCKRLYNISTPLLYSSILISTTTLSLKQLRAIIKAIPVSLLMYTQRVDMVARFQERKEAEFDRLVVEMDVLFHVCMSLERLKLKRFRYELNTCIPGHIRKIETCEYKSGTGRKYTISSTSDDDEDDSDNNTMINIKKMDHHKTKGIGNDESSGERIRLSLDYLRHFGGAAWR